MAFQKRKAIALFVNVIGVAFTLMACEEVEFDGEFVEEESTELSVDRFRFRRRLPPQEAFAVQQVREGRDIFRYDTFGDEAYWGGELRLHEAIAGQANGGVGPGISPKEAIELGLRVDVEALPRRWRRRLRWGAVDLDDPATTIKLLKLDAIIGVTGFFDDAGDIESVGIQCALCHSVVDDSFMPGIGRRLDGWPNRDLDFGKLVASAPDLSSYTSLLGVSDGAVRSVLSGWGRGKLDPFLNLDGKIARPDGGSAATLIPTLFNLSGVGLMGWNAWAGWGTWQPFIIVLEMRGQGNYFDRRIADPEQFPVAAANGFDRIRVEEDLVSPKLPALQQYVYSLQAPEPPPGFFNPVMAKRGRTIFENNCSGCHAEGIRSLPGLNVIPASVIGIDSFQADRSPNRGYRPPPLRGMFTRKNGFFHDGRFETLDEVVDHFDTVFGLGLSSAEQADLVEYLKSL